MSDPFIFLGDILINVPVWFLNGLLYTGYALLEAAPALLSLACAGLIMRFIDRRVQLRAGYRPVRDERERPDQDGRSAQILTGITIFIWLLSQWGMGAPVPALGAAMWLVGTAVLFLARQQETTLLWQVRSGILIYGLAVAGSRLYLAYAATLSAEQWAALIGSTENAAVVLASTRSSVTTIILWGLWLVIPLAYFAMLLQQALANPYSLIRPLASAGELIERYRTRR